MNTNIMFIFLLCGVIAVILLLLMQKFSIGGTVEKVGALLHGITP